MKAYRTEYNFEKTAKKVTYINVLCNLFLSVVKFAVGIIAHSGAMISDSINSISDVLSAAIVIIGLKISSKKSDRKHPYGHERFECVAAIILAVFLFVTAIFIGHTSLEKIISQKENDIIMPGAVALVVTILSMIIKECMCRYTKHYAKILNSSSLMGIAWDNRSDVFSTLCVLIGIIGSRLGIFMLDNIASLIVCVFIIKASYNIFNDAIGKMVDSSCPEETEESMKKCAEEQQGVLRVDLIQTRMFGNKIYVDIEICVDPQIPLVKAHQIAEKVHDSIENKFPNVKHIMVHINPAENSISE